MENILEINSRAEFREWLIKNSTTAKECWVALKRGKPQKEDVFYYLDAVEEALCFGWIDSTNKKVNDILLRRFSPRKPNSPWTELNKERVRRLEKLGQMTDAGRAVLPDMAITSFTLDTDIEAALKEAGVWETFLSFPPLYQRIRGYNTAFYKKRDPEQYKKALNHLIKETAAGKMYGEWNDYGRLTAAEKE